MSKDSIEKHKASIAEKYPEISKRGIPVRQFTRDGRKYEVVEAYGLERVFSTAQMVYSRDGNDILVGIMVGKSMLLGPYKLPKEPDEKEKQQAEINANLAEKMKEVEDGKDTTANPL